MTQLKKISYINPGIKVKRRNQVSYRQKAAGKAKINHENTKEEGDAHQGPGRIF